MLALMKRLSRQEEKQRERERERKRDLMCCVVHLQASRGVPVDCTPAGESMRARKHAHVPSHNHPSLPVRECICVFVRTCVHAHGRPSLPAGAHSEFPA